MYSNLLEDPKLFRHVVEDLPVGIYFVDRERRIRFWNRGAEHLTGYLSHEVVGHVLEAVVQACDRQGESFTGEERLVTVTLNERRPQLLTAFFLHKNGHRVPMSVRTLPIVERSGAVVGATVLFEEMFGYQQGTSGPAMYGCLDAVTGIPSRRLTQAVLSECMTGIEGSNVGFGLIRIRLLGLNEFGAKHGPQSVSPFLRTAAHTLRHILDAENFLGCWGEYEFLVVLPSASPVTVATTSDTLWHLLSHSEVLWWGDHFLVESEIAHAVVNTGDNLEAVLRKMRPAHSSGISKAAAAGAGSNAERGRG